MVFKKYESFRGNKMLNTNEKVNPAVLALVELGNGIGGTKVSGSTREEIGKKSSQKAFLMSKERSKKNVATA